MKPPRASFAVLSATATFRLLMALSGILIVAGVLLHIPARMIVAAAPCAVAMLMLQTARGDGCRFAAGIAFVWVLTMAGVLLAPLIGPLARPLGLFAAFAPLAALGIAALALLTGYVGFRAPTSHRPSIRLLFFLLGAVVQIVILELVTGPYF